MEKPKKDEPSENLRGFEGEELDKEDIEVLEHLKAEGKKHRKENPLN